MAKSVLLVDGMASMSFPCLSARDLQTRSIRLYATRTMKPLGTLKYHKTGCQAVEFARSIGTAAVKGKRMNDDEDSDDEMNEDEQAARARWLVGGGKDNRISVWSLISFTKNR